MNKGQNRDFVKIFLDNFIWFILAILFTYFAVNVPNFTSKTNLINILLHASVLGVLTIGQTIVLLTGNFDLSAEGMVSLSTIFAMWLMITPGTVTGTAQGSGLMMNPYLVIPIILILGTVVGYLIGIMITRLNMNGFIVTLAAQLVLRGVAMIISNGQIMTGSPKTFNWLGGAKLYGFPVSVIVTLLLYVGVNYLLNQSKFGRELRAVGANPDAARASGFNPKRTITMAYTIGGFLAAFAGWMLLGRLETTVSSLGSGMTLETVAASVIGGVSLKGGIGSVGGAFAGVLLLSLIDNALNLMSVDSFWVESVRGFIILVALLIEAQKFRYKPKIVHEKEPAVASDCK